MLKLKLVLELFQLKSVQKINLHLTFVEVVTISRLDYKKVILLVSVMYAEFCLFTLNHETLLNCANFFRMWNIYTPFFMLQSKMRNQKVFLI